MVLDRYKSFQVLVGCWMMFFFLVVKVFDKLGSATVLVTFGHVLVLRRGAFVGPPTAFRRTGTNIPWVSLLGPTGVLPIPKQDGIGKQSANPCVVVLCFTLICN